MQIKSLRAALMGVSAYREILEQDVMVCGRKLLDTICAGKGEEALDAYTTLFFKLRQNGFWGIGDWLWDALRFTASPYGRMVEQGGIDPALENTARREVETLLLFATEYHI